MTYTLTRQDAASITTPPYTFTDADPPTLDIYTTDASHVESAVFLLTATADVDTSITASETFTVNIQNLVDCSTPTITLAAQSDITYRVSNSQSDTTFTPFTISPSGCGMTYTLTMSDGTAITNAALTFDASNPSLSLYTTDNNQVETMNLKLIATSDDDSSVSDETSFQVDIIADCTITSAA
jgi:hypothetical protein